MLCARVQRREDVGLQDLCCLLNDDHLWPQLLQQNLVLGDSSGGHAHKVHLAEDLQLPVPLQGRAVEGVALELPRDLWQHLPRFVVRLQQPLLVCLPLQAQGQAPEVLLMPVEIPLVGPERLDVLFPVGQPSVLQIRAEIASLLDLLLLHVQLAVVLLVVGLFLLLVLILVLVLGLALVPGVLVLEAGDGGGWRQAAGSLADHRSQLRKVRVCLQPSFHHALPQPFVPFFVIHLIWVQWQFLCVVAEVLQVATPETEELLLLHDALDIVKLQDVLVNVPDQLGQLLAELVAALVEAPAGVEVLPGCRNLRNQLFEVSRLHRLALRAGADTRDPLAEAENALQELIQRVVGVADHEHGRVPAAAGVVQQRLNDLQADPCLSCPRWPLDQGHLVREGVVDGVQLRWIDVQGFLERLRPLLQNLEALGGLDFRVSL
mmetsp:Transcript_22445/g.63722  ORF Transcript_22445/g.63722 Transcript_22445/m.63722 type:complete len:433 (+) Transcript_22445:1476-2774(+)